MPPWTPTFVGENGDYFSLIPKFVIATAETALRRPPLMPAHLAGAG